MDRVSHRGWRKRPASPPVAKTVRPRFGANDGETTEGLSQKLSAHDITAPCRFSRQERKIGGQRYGRNFLDPCWLVQPVNEISSMGRHSIYGSISFTVRTRRGRGRNALKPFWPSISLIVHTRWTGSGENLECGFSGVRLPVAWSKPLRYGRRSGGLTPFPRAFD